MKLRLLLFLYAFCFIFIPVKSNDFIFNHLSVEDGLYNNFVKTVFKDSYGYVWFGTLEGLDRYDGLEIRNYSTFFLDEIKSVNGITEDQSKKIWFGTEDGVYFWDRITDHFQKITWNNGETLSVTHLQYYGQNTIFLCSNKGFYTLNTESLSINKISFHKDINTLLNKASDFFIENDQVFIALDKGLVMYDIALKSSIVFNYDEDSGFSRFTCITKTGNDLFLGTQSNGVIRFSTKSKRYTSLKEIGNDIVLSITSDKEKLYVGTDANGLKIYNLLDDTVTVLEHNAHISTSISSNAIYSLYLDKDGLLWAGTYAGGVNFASRIDNTFKVFGLDYDQSFLNKSIRSLYFDEAGRKFIGTRNGLYLLDKKARLTYFDPNKTSLKAKIILSLFPYRNKILIGTYGGGISSYNTETKQLRAWQKDIFDGQYIYGFDTDQKENIWIGGLNGLFVLDKNKEVKQFTSLNSALKDSLIYTLKIDSSERIWVGTMSGLFIFNYEDGRLNLISDFPELQDTKVVSFFLDSSNAMWVSTEKRGVFRVNMDLITEQIITDKKGLSNNSVSAVIEVLSGKFWISTLKGLSFYNEKDSVFTKFSQSSALPGLAFNPGACVIDQDSVVWFGNEKGLIYFNPRKLVGAKANSKIVITDIYIEGRPIEKKYLTDLHTPVEELENIVLQGKMNSIGFRFVDLKLNKAIKRNFLVQLEGQDASWREMKNENSVFYNNLKPRSYNFKIGFDDGAGNVIEESLHSFKFKIRAEWYRSSKFYGLVIIILLSLLGYFNYLIVGTKKRLSQMMEVADLEREKYEWSRLDTDESKMLLEEIIKYVESTTVYLDPDLKIGKLAQHLHCSVHDISQSINQNLNQGFTDFINHYRITELQQKMNDPKNDKYTLIALAESCGFNSKSSFYRAFKRVTGMTPAAYIAEHSDRGTV